VSEYNPTQPPTTIASMESFIAAENIAVVPAAE